MKKNDAFLIGTIAFVTHLAVFAVGYKQGKMAVARVASALAASTNVITEGNKWLHTGPATHEPIHVRVDLSDWITLLSRLKEGNSASVYVCKLCFQPCGIHVDGTIKQESRGSWPLPWWTNEVSTLTEIPTNVLIMQLSDSEMAAFQAWRKRRTHTTNDWPNGKMPVKVDRALTNWSVVDAQAVPH